MDENPQESQSLLMHRVALSDLQRRRAEISPQVDVNIEEALKICEERLKEAGEPPAPGKNDEHWEAEYNFWHKLISEEVERLRFNEGYEPVRIDLYPASQGPIAFLGETQVGHIKFEAVGRWGSDSSGQKVLRVTILKAK